MLLKIKITDATREDLKEINQFRKEWTISVPKVRELKGSQLLVARIGGKLVGFMHITNTPTGELKIRRLAVRKKYRGQRIGRKLVAVARSIGINEGKKLITSSVPNYSTNRFWSEHAKFSEVVEDKYSHLKLSRDYELDPVKQSHKRRRKAKGILKFLNLKQSKPIKPSRRK